MGVAVVSAVSGEAVVSVFAVGVGAAAGVSFVSAVAEGVDVGAADSSASAEGETFAVAVTVVVVPLSSAARTGTTFPSVRQITSSSTTILDIFLCISMPS